MNLWIITVIGVGILIACIRHPEQFFLYLLLAVIILLLLYMSYGPRFSRKRRARKIASQKGDYRLVLTETYIQFGDKMEKVSMRSKKVLLYSSENMFTLKTDRDVLAIPKRILSEEQKNEVQRLAKLYHAKIITVLIEKE